MNCGLSTLQPLLGHMSSLRNGTKEPCFGKFCWSIGQALQNIEKVLKLCLIVSFRKGSLQVSRASVGSVNEQ